MIAYLHGSLALKSSDRIIIDVNNVGYEVEISTQTYEQLPEESKKLKLLIYHHFTDNDQRLFGFFTENEKQLFELLITVKGVGPKLGLKILSGLPAVQIIEAIMQGDKSSLTQISGIGAKTAQRMLLELKDKMEEMALHPVNDASGTAVSGNVKEEAVAALLSLGIKKKDARSAVQAAGNEVNPDDGVGLLVKKALSKLNK
jgi:Holliday junction DNA helicase RuvA